MNKLLLLSVVSLLLLSGLVYALDTQWSNPTHRDGSAIEWKESQPAPVKTLTSKDNYNQIFEDYRNGILSQKEASNKLKVVKIR